MRAADLSQRQSGSGKFHQMTDLTAKVVCSPEGDWITDNERIHHVPAEGLAGERPLADLPPAEKDAGKKKKREEKKSKERKRGKMKSRPQNVTGQSADKLKCTRDQ